MDYKPDSTISTVIKKYDNISIFRSIVVGRLREQLGVILRKWNCSAYKINSITNPLERNMAKDLRLRYRNITARDGHKQEKEGRKLMRQCGLREKDVYSMEDIEKIQLFLTPEIRLHIITIDRITKKTTPLWAGAFQSEMNIVLAYNGVSFYIINSSYRLLRGYYCLQCCKTSNHKNNHRCHFTCTRCGSTECNNKGGETIICDDCRNVFYSLQCFNRHLQTNRQGKGNRCGILKICPRCHIMYNKNNLQGQEHECGKTTWCGKCQQLVVYKPIKNTNITHPCYWKLPTEKQKKEARKRQERFEYIFYDMECVQNTIKPGDELVFNASHVPCCIVVRKICYQCVNIGIDDHCENCQEREKIFSYTKSTDVLQDFAEYLLNSQHNNRIVMAHCGGRYDHLILLHQLIKMEIYPDIIMRGCTILQATIKTLKCNLKLKDTYALIPMALDAMKKAFGLDVEDKGMWPYLFTTTNNYGLCMNGLPDIKFYNTGSMKPDKRTKFLQWYNSHDQTYIFEFDKELIEYCRTDTKILTMGSIAYQKAVLFATGWDPIVHSMTLASFTNFLMRYQHLTGKKIAHIPERGLSNQRQQSEGAVKWMEWIMYKDKIHICHAYNGGEQKFGNYSVDGWCEETKTIYEYYGCYWHGCEKCHRSHEKNRSNGHTFGDLLKDTRIREQWLIETTGYRVIAVWGCEVQQELSKNTEMEEFHDCCLIGGRLRPRTAMQGGRTEAFVSELVADDEHEIVYLDFSSLYPSVMVNTELPTGFPEVILNGFTDNDLRHFQFKGLGHITILPPRHLQYPLLGVKMRKSLLFSLCRLCALLNHRGKCTHNDDERALTCTWTHLEIQKAISLGYKILKIWEVWRWDTWDDSLFHSYINTFFKMKQEASGWPDRVQTEAEKQQYVEQCRVEMGLELDPSKIDYNPALRYAMKQLLNSCWGKYAQKADLPKTEYVSNDQLHDLIESTLVDVKSHYHVGDDTYLVTHAPIEEEVHSAPYGNLPLAIYITSQARLRLYHLLELSAGNAGYCDTDSCIAKVPRNNNPFATLIGEGLGKLTSEVPAGFEIKKAIFKGPKQYAIRMVNAQGEVRMTEKIRGLTIDHDASKLISFETLEKLADDEEIQTRRFQLKRHLPSSTIRTVEQEKRYKKVNNKNVPQGHRLYPFGHDGIAGTDSDFEENQKF